MHVATVAQLEAQIEKTIERTSAFSPEAAVKFTLRVRDLPKLLADLKRLQKPPDFSTSSER